MNESTEKPTEKFTSLFPSVWVGFGFIIYLLWLCCHFCDVYVQILTDVIFVSLLVNVV